jgi:hypothetical protein
MPTAFDLETRDGFRRVELDADVIRFRDVRILVDGQRVAEMPYPKADTPYHEVAFRLGRHELVAVAHLLARPTSDEPLGVRYDLFADGRSLSDGSSLVETRARAPAPGETYPQAFQVIDMILRIAPAAAAPGIAVGVSGGGSELGWPAVAGLVILMLATMAVATLVAARAWARIRADDRRSVRTRTILGGSAVVGSYVVALVLTLGVALLITQAG